MRSAAFRITFWLVVSTFLPLAKTATAQTTCTTPSFQEVRFFATLGTHPSRAAVADFNGDGRPDVAVSNIDSLNISIFLGDGAGGFAPAAIYSPGFYPNPIAVFDFNHDGNLDLAVGDLFGGRNVSILMGDGTGAFGPPSHYAAGSSSYEIAIADFNGDGKADLATVGLEQSNVAILLGNGDGSFRLPARFSTGTRPTSVKTADLNADGKFDLVVGGSPSAAVAVLLGDGTGGFTAPSFLGVYGLASIGDFDADGKVDIVTQYGAVLLGNGDATFQPPTSFASADNLNGIEVGDFSGDGILDVASNNGFGGAVVVFLGDGAGHFGSPGYFYAGVAPAVLATDANLDGRPDFILPNYFDNTFSILLNSGPAGTLVVRPLFDQSKAFRAGSTIPVKIQLLGCSNENLSSPNLAVKAIDVRLTGATTSAPVVDSGNSNPDFNFRYDATLDGTGGYIYNLSTKGLAAGTYALRFTAGGAAIHSVSFEVK
ncbi:MAG TPA: FG-GAP-like repeat-containing protein [Methylococcaceae bacterium]|nr:FG-GAP-like repeat-containing protein [Methylococcaceae bacterium]